MIFLPKRRTLMLAGIVVLAIIAAWCAGRWTAPTPNPVIVRELIDRGFRPADPVKPKMPDAPRGTVPIAHISGTVDSRPPSPPPSPGGEMAGQPLPAGGAVGAAPVPAGAGAVPVLSPHTVLAEHLGGRCTADILTLKGQPWARLYWTGWVDLPEGRVTRGPELVPDAEAQVRLPRRSLLDARVLVVVEAGRVGWQVGATYWPGRSWWGIAGDHERLAGVGRSAVGFAARW